MVAVHQVLLCKCIIQLLTKFGIGGVAALPLHLFWEGAQCNAGLDKYRFYFVA